MSKKEIYTDEIVDYFTNNLDRTWIFLDTETLGFQPGKHQMLEVAAVAMTLNMDSTFDLLSHYHEKAKLLSITRLRMSYPYSGKGLSYRDLLKMTKYGEPLKDRVYIDERDMLSQFFAFVESFNDPILVAHNSSFDMRFLNGRHNVYFDNKNPYDDYEVLDTLKIMRKYFTALVVTESKRFKHRWLKDVEASHILKMRRIRKTLQKKKGKRMSLKLGNVANALGLENDGCHTARFDVNTLVSATQIMLSMFGENYGKTLYPEKTFL